MKSLLDAGDAATLLDASIAGQLPDERGRFGPFGGRYVPETLVPAFERLERGIAEHLHSDEFQAAFREAMESLDVVALFVRQNPLIDSSWLFESAGEVVEQLALGL